MRSESEKIDEGPELTIVSLSGEVPGPGRRPDGPHRTGRLRTGQLFIRQGRGSCLIHMISAGGLLIETELPIVPGDEIGIEIRSGHGTAGQVAWADAGFAGIRFTEWVDVLQLLGNEALEGFPPRDQIHTTARDRSPGPVIKPTPRPALIPSLGPVTDRIA